MQENDWKPGASLDALRARARLNTRVREFFAARGVLEVETPLSCSATATDLHLASMRLDGATPRFLQTSPEFAMKRLLAAGSGPIYQLCKAFRAGDRGLRHNPEFTLLEWYRPGYSLAQLMDEVEALLVDLLGREDSGSAMRFAACERVSYRELFEARFGFNPHVAAIARLRETVARETSYGDAGDLDEAACLDLLFATSIEPALGQSRPVFVSGFPAVQAALSRVQVDEQGDRVAVRCEVYVRGMELANGYDELTDAAEQRRRFEADNLQRRARGLPEVPVDHRLLAALEAGIPACAGIALGMDRLLMLWSGAPDLDAVLAFTDERA